MIDQTESQFYDAVFLQFLTDHGVEKAAKAAKEALDHRRKALSDWTNPTA